MNNRLRAICCGALLLTLAFICPGHISSAAASAKDKFLCSTVFIVDTSGSMNDRAGERNKIGAVRESLRAVSSILENENRYGNISHSASLVTYSDNAEIKLHSTTNSHQMVSIADGIHPNGGTDIGEGLTTALELSMSEGVKSYSVLSANVGTVDISPLLTGIVTMQKLKDPNTIKQINGQLRTIKPEIFAVYEVKDVDQLEDELLKGVGEYAIKGHMFDFICIKADIIKDSNANYLMKREELRTAGGYSSYVIFPLKDYGNLPLKVIFTHAPVPYPYPSDGRKEQMQHFRWIAESLKISEADKDYIKRYCNSSIGVLPTLIIGDFNNDFMSWKGNDNADFIRDVVNKNSMSILNPGRDNRSGHYEATVLVAIKPFVGGLTIDWTLCNNGISARYGDTFELKTMGPQCDHLGLYGRIVPTAYPSNVKRIAVLLSDGMVTSGLSDARIISQVIPGYVKDGVKLYTIGYGSANQFDEEFLSEAALATGGQYFHAGEERKLEDVFIDIRHTSQGDVIHRYADTIAQGESRETFFDIDDPFSELHLTLNWPGSRLDMEIYDPQGRRIGGRYRGAHLYTDARPAHVVVEDPLLGHWRVVINGTLVERGKEPFDVIASVRGLKDWEASPIALAVFIILSVVCIGMVLFYSTCNARRKKPEEQSNA